METDMNMPNNDLPPQYAVPTKKRSPMIWIIPLILVVLGSPVLCCGGLIWFGYSQATAPIAAGIEVLNADAEVVEKLGSPITQGSSFSLKNFTNNNGNGSCEIGYSVDAPKGGAKVDGKMKLIAGVWSPDGLTITFQDGTTKTFD